MESDSIICYIKSIYCFTVPALAAAEEEVDLSQRRRLEWNNQPKYIFPEMTGGQNKLGACSRKDRQPDKVY